MLPQPGLFVATFSGFDTFTGSAAIAQLKLGIVLNKQTHVAAAKWNILCT